MYLIIFICVVVIFIAATRKKNDYDSDDEDW